MGRAILNARTTARVNDFAPHALALDLPHLNSSTFGDAQLRDEILRLFMAQLQQSRGRLLDAVSAEDWRFVTHTLKGAAAAVGASQFHALAQSWEACGGPPCEDDRAAMLAEFDRAEDAFRFAAKTLLAA